MMDNEILINQTQIFLMLLKNVNTLETYLFSKSCRKKKSRRQQEQQQQISMLN